MFGIEVLIMIKIQNKSDTFLSESLFIYSICFYHSFMSFYNTTLQTLYTSNTKDNHLFLECYSISRMYLFLGAPYRIVSIKFLLIGDTSIYKAFTLEKFLIVSVDWSLPSDFYITNLLPWIGVLIMLDH